jgi:hypothetical protein
MAKRERTRQKKQPEADQKHRPRQNESQPQSERFHAWEQGKFPIGETPFRPHMDQHAALLARAGSDGNRANRVLRLQQTYGNRYVQRLVESAGARAKLTVSPPNDSYEHQADRVARAVTGGVLVRAQPQPEEKQSEARLAGRQPAPLPENLETRINRARGSGQPLPDIVRAPMERALGADFSGVRLHTDSEADVLNQQLSARAFTTGQDVFFREGGYSPGSDSGRELIAHELTHVAQQSTARCAVEPPEPDNAQTPGQAACVRAAPQGQIQRWAEDEHQAMGDKAWQLVEPKVEKKLGQKPPAPMLEKLGKVTYGKLTQLGGDYAQTVEELKQIKSKLLPVGGLCAATDYLWYNSPSFGSTEKQRAANYQRMVKIAETNVDHFSPLAQVQYKQHHKTAVDKAAKAAAAARELGREEGEKKAPFNDALVTEGFAAHFLQDSYASGHQCPRALDEIPEGTSKWGKTLGSLGTKNYHDMLCEIAVPIAGPAAGWYHGDLAATGKEITRLAGETAKSLEEVLATYWGFGGAPQAAPSDGPDMAKIEGDPKLAKTWKKMVGGYKSQEKRVEAYEKKRRKKRGLPELIEMPGTKTKYTRQQIIEYYKRISGKK